MNTEDLQSDIFNDIIETVVKGIHSPYNEMIRKTKDIDIDYFENICRGIDTLSEDLNPEIKWEVVDAFEKMADNYYKNGDLESRLLNIVKNEAEAIRNKYGADSVGYFLNYLADNLQFYTEGSNLYAGITKYTDEDVKHLYKHAKHVTLKEFFLGGNDQDILSFYEALMDNTFGACREIVVKRTNEFILELTKKIRETRPER